MSEEKKPAKGILKASSSFDKKEKAARRNKNAKWDEMNIIATFHPPDKDYGHMKVDEPKTPYNWEFPDDETDSKTTKLDPSVLSDKLSAASTSSRRSLTPSASEDDDEDDENMGPDELERRREFKNRRMMHYNEFKAVQLARRLIQEEDGDDEKESQPGEPIASVSGEGTSDMD